MSASNSKHVSGGSLRRTRSAGDDPSSINIDVANSSSEPPHISGDNASSSTVITIPKEISDGPRSAGPTFNIYAIPESQENENNPANPSLPRTPPAVILNTAPAPPPPLVTQTNTIPTQPPQGPAFSTNRSTITKLFLFFGYGPGASRTRRVLVSFIWTIAWGFAQMVAIVAILASSASKPSPTVSGANEWTACDRPLGLWSCFWLVRIIMSFVLGYWGWTRDKSGTPQDAEARPNERPQNAPVGHLANREPPDHAHSRQSSSSSTTSPQSQSTHVRHTTTFRRLSLFSSFFSLTWFLTAHILIYTSLKTCRFSSPHIWWLVFGILCITYIMILEVILLGLVVFLFAPVILLVWNIFLLCIGRHPLQNPHMIKPDIGKLPKSLVDRIPLVMYIPPPPDAPPREGPIQVPESVYSYPPKPPLKTPNKKRFKFIRFKKPSKSVQQSAGGNESDKTTETGSWENNWATEGYPFVVLEDNRAACAICLLDFEEPKRLNPISGTQVDEGASKPKAEEVTTQTVEVISEEQREPEELQLADAGEGAQPLRLLTCGHVFHKTCLDPWLTDVSGRCPVCQRAVEIPESGKKKKGRQRQG
ncbi:hypothetical protein BDP27DRAFT_926620 [Rhodocollybia butyracea]|uniref:RING-type domain-containing protein n=1 Tax=Rhodocollybia butyracea TaxID=206335 RepID=A0A9P5P1P0_9AGAR|nr:hypothetical protein BDP27DRAFT_926620 [Rhodocollybia butyracea]